MKFKNYLEFLKVVIPSTIKALAFRRVLLISRHSLSSDADHPWKVFKESIRNFSIESQTELFHFSQFVHFTWNAVNWSAFPFLSSFVIYNFSYLEFNNEFVQLTIQLYNFKYWKILISINLICFSFV